MYRQTQTAQREINMRPPKPPERPFAPYMRFSRKMFPKIRQENPDAPIWDIGKTMSELWRNTPEAEKAIYNQEYEVEKVEYEKALKAYYNSPAYLQYLAARTRVKPNEKILNNRKGGITEVNNVTGVIIQPCDDEDPFEVTGKKLSALRFDRNNRLMAELFAPNYLPDSRTIIPQQRIDTLKRQGHSLSQHQSKLNDELNRLDELFNQRKRALESASKAFDEQLKKVCKERPQLSEERYDLLVNEWQGILLKSYEDYKKRQVAIRVRLEAERRKTPVLYSLTCDDDNSETTHSQQFVSDNQRNMNNNGIKNKESENGVAESENGTNENNTQNNINPNNAKKKFLNEEQSQ